MAIKRILQSSISGGDIAEDKILHSKAKNVDMMSDEIEQLICNLRDTLWAYPFCVGISAPQIGCDYAVSVVNFNHESKGEDLILINPVILETSGKKDKKRESCMSVWGKMGEVERRAKITIEFMDEFFETKQLSYNGFAARVIQLSLIHI